LQNDGVNDSAQCERSWNHNRGSDRENDIERSSLLHAPELKHDGLSASAHKNVMLSEALQRNAKHYARLSNISGPFHLRKANARK
jgi:hypothetical protein